MLLSLVVLIIWQRALQQILFLQIIHFKYGLNDDNDNDDDDDGLESRLWILNGDDEDVMMMTVRMVIMMMMMTKMTMKVRAARGACRPNLPSD